MTALLLGIYAQTGLCLLYTSPAFDVAALLAPPDIRKSKCALCIQPHPDDNEIGMGGTVAGLAQAGCTVHYLTVTNGDQGNKNRTASPQEDVYKRQERHGHAQRHARACAEPLLHTFGTARADICLLYTSRCV